MAAKNSQLQESYEILRKNQSQLTDEVNRLKNHIKGKWCPDGWTRFGCSCYCKYKETKSWSDSRKHCQDRGADLVIIDSPEEQDFVKQLNKEGESWIGLQRVLTGTTGTYEWEWVDGSPVTKMFWEASLSRYGYATCCNDDGEWIRRYSSYHYGWICEK
ncbi:CD209 antigen-like protein A [Fundulus heteroclitus]|uniref:CD209 antigen-like protein A n=1 Tax=Fundulus heteroclitus TaxID=8078 RepID=UPI00165BB134|nr:CD209 antigen-like protein A [Fundulus heteroclitus]